MKAETGKTALEVGDRVWSHDSSGKDHQSCWESSKWGEAENRTPLNSPRRTKLGAPGPLEGEGGISGNWATLLVMVYSGSHKNSFLVFCQFRGLPGWHRTCALLDTCHMVDNSECCWAKTWLPEKFVSSCCCCRHGDQWLLQGGSGGGPRDLGQAFGECVRLFWTGDAAGIQFIFIYSLLKLFYIFKNFFFLQSCLFTKRIDLICFIYSFMNMRMLPTHLHFISPITLSPSFLIFLLILL